MITFQSLYNNLSEQKIPDDSKMIYHSFELHENIPKELTLFDKVVDMKQMNEIMKKVNETASVKKPVVKIEEIMKKVDSRNNIVNFIVKDKFIECVETLTGVYDRNVSNFDSFIMSVLTLLNDEFIYMDTNVKKNMVVQFRTLIASQLVDKDLYRKFGYDLNAKVSKRRLQKQLMDFKENSDLSVYSLLGQFIADYLQLDIIIFREESGTVKHIIACEIDDKSGSIPFIVLYQTKNNSYISMRTSDRCIFKWSDSVFNIEKPTRVNVEIIRNEKIKQREIEKIELDENITEKKISVLLERDLKKMKLDDLKKLLDENEISHTKKSDKTNKDIKKTKQDMIDDLLAL